MPGQLPRRTLVPPGQPSSPAAPGHPPSRSTSSSCCSRARSCRTRWRRAAVATRSQVRAAAANSADLVGSPAVARRLRGQDGMRGGWGACGAVKNQSSQGCLASRPSPPPIPRRCPQASRWTPTLRRRAPTVSSPTSSTVSLMCCPPAGLTKPLVNCWVSTRRVDHVCIRHAHLQPAPRLQAATPRPILLPCRPLCGMQASAPRAR